jgi:hypothetical protein
MIRIENKKTYRGKGIYVGRKMPGIPGSLLGNPFRIGCDGTRVQIISKYRRWLWEQIKLKNEAYDELRRIAELARQGDVTLVCWCVPELCHATVIERSVEFLNSAGAVGGKRAFAVFEEKLDLSKRLGRSCRV